MRATTRPISLGTRAEPRREGNVNKMKADHKPSTVPSLAPLTGDPDLDPTASLLHSLRLRPDFLALEAPGKKMIQEALRLLDRGRPASMEDAEELHSALASAYGELDALKRGGLFAEIELPTPPPCVPRFANGPTDDEPPMGDATPTNVFEAESRADDSAGAAQGAGDCGEPASQCYGEDHQNEAPRGTHVPLGIQRVSIACIQRGPDVHTRYEIDRATVEQYAAAMEAGAVFPPPQLFFDGETYWPGDGFHRLEARLQAGHEDILADVGPGDRRAAILHALTCDRNLPRTNSDKRKAVELLLADAEWRAWSDREIASRCAVSAPFVGKTRKKLGYVDSDRTGKDGRRRTVTGIGPRSTPNCKPFTVEQRVDGESLVHHETRAAPADPGETNEPLLEEEVDQPPAIYQYTGALKRIMARVQVAVDEATELANKWRNALSPDLEPSIPNLEEVAAHLQTAAEMIELNLMPAQLCPDCGGTGDDCDACAGTGWFARSELSDDESGDDPQRSSLEQPETRYSTAVVTEDWEQG
jgi:hypothetical protein